MEIKEPLVYGSITRDGETLYVFDEKNSAIIAGNYDIALLLSTEYTTLYSWWEKIMEENEALRVDKKKKFLEGVGWGVIGGIILSSIVYAFGG